MAVATRFDQLPVQTQAPVGRTPIRAAGSRRRLAGFSLVELMITLAVAVVLIAIAVPSFQRMILSNKLTTTANDVVGSISAARMAAIKRNASAQLCSDSATNNTSGTLGSACAAQPGAVYVLTSSTAATGVKAGVVGIDSRIKLKGNMAAVRFDGTGLGHVVGSTSLFDGTVADICTSGMSKDNGRHIVMTAGSIVTVTNATWTTCP